MLNFRRNTLMTGILFFAGTAQAEVSDGVVKIGVLNDMSGPYADMSGMGSVYAAQLAIEDFKKNNPKIRVELLSADHQNKPDIGTSIANKWFDVEKVDAIFDLPNSAVALAVQDLAKRKGKVSFVSGAATSDLTNDACSPTGFHWSFDTYSQANAMAKALALSGGKAWYFLTADYNFGHSMEAEMIKALKQTEAEVVKTVRHPFPTTDFSSFLLEASASKADVLALANAGADTINAVKQARQFQLQKRGKKLAALVLFITDTHSIGLNTAQGLTFVTGHYWGLDDKTRDLAKRFAKLKENSRPTVTQAGTYSSVLHYLKAVARSGSDEALTVAKSLRENPVDDAFARNASVRKDGRMIHDMYLMQVKAPAESKEAWDYYKLLKTIPAAEAFKPIDEGTCKL